ncbi:MAG: hypothetical protein ACRD96_06290 [Bryobacteraceae bacterium]
MSVWSCPAALAGLEGELVSISVSVEARELESLLDALAAVRFPVNPQIHHYDVTVVSFPAYSGNIEEVHNALRAAGFDPAAVRVRAMLEELRCR